MSSSLSAYGCVCIVVSAVSCAEIRMQAVESSCTLAPDQGVVPTRSVRPMPWRLRRSCRWSPVSESRASFAEALPCD